MKKLLKIWSSLIFVLFIFPIVLEKIPREIPEEGVVVQIDERKLVYAANIIEMEPEVQTGISALLYTTHSHEAFEPITLKHDGKIAVYHMKENIMNPREKIKTQLEFNGRGWKI